MAKDKGILFYLTHLIRLQYFNPVITVFGCFRSQIPKTVVHRYIEPTWIEFVSLKGNGISAV